MKLLLLTLGVIASSVCYSQKWTEEHEAVLAKFQLLKEDTRGLQFVPHGTSGCEKEFSTAREALEYFFAPGPMHDVLVLCVKDFGEAADSKGELLDLYHIVDLYVILTAEKINE